MPNAKSIAGTWRLCTYEVWTPEGQISTPLGESPVGYAVFDEAGHAFIQLARAPDQSIDRLNAEGVREALADSFTAYFGKYLIDTEGTKLTIRVEGSNRASYVGSVQERMFALAEHTLIMGQPGQYRAVLSRQ